MSAIRFMFALRLPKDEAEVIRRAAEQDNRSVNQWIRLRALEQAKKELNIKS